LIRAVEQDDSGDLDNYEKTEENNRQYLNIIAYAIAFLIYNFSDVDDFTYKSNISWTAKQLVAALKVTDRGRKLDRPMYYSLRERIRDYLKIVNTDLTRIDDQPIDVWKHSYERFDRTLQKLGLPQDLQT